MPKGSAVPRLTVPGSAVLAVLGRLLITMFRSAADLGGLVLLRILSCLATVLVVLGSASVVGRMRGHRRRAGRQASRPRCARTRAWAESPSTESCSQHRSSLPEWRP